MVPPTGAGAGYGYGTYSFTLNTHGGAIGDYALLWPATDVWPGPELDVVELDWNGQPYSAIHWRGANGSNQYTSYPLDKFNFNPNGTHTYSMEWARDRITVSVDGIAQYTTREHVPLSYADGGQNSAPSVGMQTWWATDAQNGDNTLTVYEVSYTPLIA
jgi:beta-glucanase (GH16 family)